MDKKSIYDLLEETLENSSKEKIIEFLTKVINILHNNFNKDIFLLINENFSEEIQNSCIKDLNKKVEKIEKQFDSINIENLILSQHNHYS